MSAREALAERTKKVTEVSREQVHAYLGANDDLYDRLRRRPAAGAKLSEKISELRGGLDLRKSVEPYKPSKLRDTVEERMEAARKRRTEHAAHGTQIRTDWRSAFAVKDAQALIKTVRSADGAGEVLKGVRTWLTDYPTWVSGPKTSTRTPAKPRPRKPATTRKTTATPKATPRKASATKATARKATARKATATKSTASKASS